MNLMTRKKAMNILDLKEGFTEDDLKRAYKKQARLHHPDNYDNASEQIRKEQEEMMKEVNSAHEFLLKNNEASFEQKTRNQNDNDACIKEMVEKLELYSNYDHSKEYASVLEPYAAKISSYVDKFKRNVKVSDELGSIIIQYLSIKTSIFEVYDELRIAFFQDNFIDDTQQYHRISLNHECSIGDFYEQLLKLVPKYSKKYKFKERLKKEKEKYFGYKGYEKVEYLIRQAYLNAFIEAQKSDYAKVYESIKLFNKQVIEIFATYYGILKVINELNTMFNKLGNLSEEELEVQNSFKKIETDFNSGASFSDIINQLQKINKKIKAIEDERERKKNINRNKEKFNNVYGLLLNRYNNKLRRIHILEQKELVDALTSVFSKCIDVINKVVLGVLPFESLLLLNRIKFDNLEEDIKVLSGILETVKEEKEPSKKENNQSNIFVLKEVPSFLSADYTMFFIYDEQNNTIYREDKAKTISNGQSELLKYIPIEDFLKHNVFLGEEGEFYGRTVTIIFDILHDSRYICLIDDKIVLLEKDRVLPLGFFSTKSLDEYKNMYSLIEMLKRQLGLTDEEPELKNTQSNPTRKKYDNSILSDIRLNF